MAYTKLKASSTSFDELMNGFGVVTVMNAKVYEFPSTHDNVFGENIEAFQKLLGQEIATIDSLKIANIPMEGPTKTISGGQYGNPLIKFGKSARLEMQDALGNAKVLEAFGGVLNTYNTKWSGIQQIHVTEDFAKPVTIIGDSFFISRTTGQQCPVKIILYQLLPDSIFNLTQDAEGDATVFDLNGDLLTTNMKIPNEDGNEVTHGLFYSILPANDTQALVINSETGAVTGKIKGSTVYNSTNGGLDWTQGETITATAGDLMQAKSVKAGRIVQSASAVKSK